MKAEHLLQVAPCSHIGEEQHEDPLVHHLPPHSAIAEANMAEDEALDMEGEDKAAMHTRLVQLQSMYDQQRQVGIVMNLW